ncbi:MAG: hypothetical protein IPJ32_07575 [Sphingobacteriaceae bacterium]|nr:hypothetical protein [Sphingobacteriaceae bacterium]
MKKFFMSVSVSYYKYIIYSIFCTLPFLVSAQTPDKIKIQKEDAVYFFQVGPKSDTISANKNDLFYLKFNGTLRCNARIEVVNGRLFKTNNDSIFQLKKSTNIQYEHYFQDSMFVVNKAIPKDKKRDCRKFVSHINGAIDGDGHTITIQIYNLNSKETLLNNTFYYR